MGIFNLTSLLIKIRFLSGLFKGPIASHQVSRPFIPLFFIGFLTLSSAQAFPKIDQRIIAGDLAGINVVFRDIQIQRAEEVLAWNSNSARRNLPFFFPNPSSKKFTKRSISVNPAEYLGYVGNGHTLYHLLERHMFPNPEKIDSEHLKLLIRWLDALRERQKYKILGRIIEEYRDNPVLSRGILEQAPRELSQFLIQHYNHFESPTELLERAQTLAQHFDSADDQAEAKRLAERMLRQPQRTRGDISAGYMVLVKLAMNVQDYRGAIDFTGKSLSLGDPDDIETLIVRGGLKKNSEPILRRALILARRKNNRRLECRVHLALGNSHTRSEDNYNDALRLALDLKDLQLEGQARVGVGKY